MPTIPREEDEITGLPMLLFCFADPPTHRLLNTAQGSLLDDEKLVNTLQFSKTTALEVEEQLEVSVQTEQKIDTAREVSCRTAGKIFFPLSIIILVKLANNGTSLLPRVIVQTLFLL